jgi:D-ribose pyranase
MKKVGVLNSQLSGIIAAMGHADRLVICDSGLPIPRDLECVDLAITKNIPRFLDVLRVVLQELQVEAAIVANEIESASPAILDELRKLLGDVKLQRVSHEEFKQISASNHNTAFVRTGEASPYANVILISGVTF